MTIKIIHEYRTDPKLINELRIMSDTFFLILKKQNKMANQLDEIAADLAAANEKADKIQADVTNLDAQIAALGEAPTPEQIAAVKEQSAALVAKLSGIDDMTADVAAPPPTGAGGETGTGDVTTGDGSGEALPPADVS